MRPDARLLCGLPGAAEGRVRRANGLLGMCRTWVLVGIDRARLAADIIDIPVAVGIRFAPGGVVYIRTGLAVSTGSDKIRKRQLKQ
jgi:hypothetical protein